MITLWILKPVFIIIFYYRFPADC